MADKKQIGLRNDSEKSDFLIIWIFARLHDSCWPIFYFFATFCISLTEKKKDNNEFMFADKMSGLISFKKLNMKMVMVAFGTSYRLQHINCVWL